MRLKILVLVIMFLGIIYLVNSAGCCVETKTGEYCKDVGSGDLCNSGYNDGVSCDQTNACKGGCCDLTQEGGGCYKGMIEDRCNNQGGNWDSNYLCLGVEGCESVCCEIGGNFYWSSYGECNNRNGDVDVGIGNEVQCVSANEEGCCVDNCRYGYGGGCSEGGFFENEICGNVVKCKEEITSHASDGCGNSPETKNDVYYFDSKGNREELIEDCDPPSTSCGDKDNDGKYKCENLDCERTWDNPLTNDDGGLRRNGESWCQYQSAVGPGLDLPGTSHYLHSCINGKEIVKNCASDRSKVCIWDDSGGKSNAACVDNEWQECLKCETNKACCEDASKLCIWVDTQYYKRCMPLVPPGNILDPGDKQDVGRGKDCARSATAGSIGEVNYLCNMFGECGADYNLGGEFKNTNFNIDKNAYLDFNALRNAGKGLYKVNENKGNLVTQTYGYIGVSYSECVSKCDASDKYKNDYTNCVTDRTAYCNTLPEWERIFDGYGHNPRKECLEGSYRVGFPPVLSVVNYCANKKEDALCAKDCGGLTSITARSVITRAREYDQLIRASMVPSYVSRACGLWDPGYGTSQCSRCKKGELLPNYKFGNEGYICTEELCTSLGSCEWIDDTIEGSACISKDIGDVSKPVISVDYTKFKYNCNKEAPGDITMCNENPQQGLEISSEPKGVSVKGELVDSYEGGNKKNNITIGISLDRYSKCRYSLNLDDSFDDMEFDLSRGKLGLNHEETFIDKIGDLRLRDGGEYIIYIRCESYNDVESDSFFVKFKKAEQPDLSPPIIYRLTFSPETESYVLYGKETEIVAFNLNEDGVCRWGKEPDKNYDDMKNELDCVDNLCGGELNVSVDENRYYFRCKDVIGNANTQDQPYDGYILYGSESNLSIDSVSCVQRLPDGSYVDNCDDILTKNFTLKIVTFGGAKSGESRCSYNGNTFFKTDGKEHEQCIGCGGEQYLLEEGSYQYRISCIDVGDNEAYKEMNTFLRIDYKAPKMERYYVDGSLFKVETNEPSYCRFTNTFNINYNTASEMASSDRLIHSTSASKDFYKVQCMDRFGNKMAPVNIYLAYI